MAESLIARLEQLKFDETGGGQWLTLKKDRIARGLLFDDLHREYRAASEVLKSLVETATDESGAIHPWATKAAEWLERNGVKR